jgi:hypothetical protein
MNRLVIIGNGFDLAHGLPTSYKDFIDDFWKYFNTNCNSDEYQKLISTNNAFNGYYSGYRSIENFDDLKANLKNYSKDYGYNYDFNNFVCTGTNRNVIFEFKSDFFKAINIKNSENWVDIENEYYRRLKIIVKITSLSKIEKKDRVIKLNLEFNQVKDLLEKYLKEKVDDKYEFRLFENNQIKDILLPETEFPFDEKQYLKEFQQRDQLYVKEFLDKSKIKYDHLTHFLNFNYTKVGQLYFDEFPYTKQLNYIHGKINNSINKVNFGFGDEMDDDYKMIENIDDNEYLKNFKSFQYLQNSNYKNLLDFVENEKFQIYIMGHSCGLSDRTLLNTIFENKNCISIKVFYHKYKEKNRDGSYDNYTEIIQNISRHFNKKNLMREKIVNKTLCNPLPQIQLPLK